MMGNSLSVVHGLSAAKKFTSKAVFCVDNLDPSVGVNELCDFARKLSVNVLSCFRAQPNVNVMNLVQCCRSCCI